MVTSTTSYGAGGNDVYLIKIDSSGTLEWAKPYGGAGEDYGRSVRQTKDGGYIITGSTSSFPQGGPAKDYLIKTSPDGSLVWSNVLGDGLYFNNGLSVQQTLDDGYILTGLSLIHI